LSSPEVFRRKPGIPPISKTYSRKEFVPEGRRIYNWTVALLCQCYFGGGLACRPAPRLACSSAPMALLDLLLNALQLFPQRPNFGLVLL